MMDDTLHGASPSPGDPDVFSRGGLMMTYKLIRNQAPQLALGVRNIANGQPIPSDNSIEGNIQAEHYFVTLDSFQVRGIIEALVKVSKSKDPGTGIMAKTLIEDWLVLARKMLSELPENEKP